jgi:hypothetical protein
MNKETIANVQRDLEFYNRMIFEYANEVRNSKDEHSAREAYRSFYYYLLSYRVSREFLIGCSNYNLIEGSIQIPPRISYATFSEVRSGKFPFKAEKDYDEV